MILMPLPALGFDPTEAAVPWWALRQAGFDVAFATPDGAAAAADPRLVEGGFGPLSPLLMTRPDVLGKYRRMTEDARFRAPYAYEAVRVEDYEGVVIPGGHAPGVKTLLESSVLQRHMVDCFARDLPVGAVCHGVLLLARSISPETGRSVLYGRTTTTLTRFMELSAWAMTCLWLGDYYRTYPTVVQEAVTAALRCPVDFVSGPEPLRRDSERRWDLGFAVRDGNYVSARWPGDCHRFAREFIDVLNLRRRGQSCCAGSNVRSPGALECGGIVSL